MTIVIPWMTKWRLAQQAPWREWGSLCLLTPLLVPSCPGLFFFTFLFYSLSIVAVALLFVYYTEPDACYEGKVFISLNLTLCICISIISVLPKVQVRSPGSARPETRPAGVWDVLWEPWHPGAGLVVTEPWAKSGGSPVSLPGLESWLSHLHFRGLWESAFTSLRLSLLKYKTRTIIPTIWRIEIIFVNT